MFVKYINILAADVTGSRNTYVTFIIITVLALVKPVMTFRVEQKPGNFVIKRPLTSQEGLLSTRCCCF